MKPASLYKRPLLASLLFLIANICSAQNTTTPVVNRQTININDHWEFQNDSVANLHPGTNNWEKVSIPHTWNDKDVLDDVVGYYRGTATYRRKLKIDQAFAGKNIALSFNGVGQQCEVYVNGKLAGKHIGGYNRFVIPISSFLNTNGDNALVIKASNKFSPDIPPLTGDFTQFGGIYRSVNLIITNPVHFSQSDNGSSGVYITTPKVDAASATVQVRTLLTNFSSAAAKIKVNVFVRNADNETVATFSATQKLAAGEEKSIINELKPILNPKLWSPETPYLYKVVTQIVDEKSKAVLDEIVNPLGIRWFKFDAETGFFLNDKHLKLIGASRHQDYAGLGNAVPEALQIRDIELLKEMGGNFLRVAHYPQDQSVLDACDRLGILTSIETPIVNTITESEAFTANSLNMQTEMIRQNFNHPSVILWAYMNEVMLQPRFGGDQPRQQQYFNAVKVLAQTLEDLTRKEDPSRYTMMADHGAFDAYNKLGLTQIPMVVGWNLYSGWYGGVLADFGKYLDRHHKELPNKPLLVTEYGADADPRIRSFAPLKFEKSIEYAIKYHQTYLKDMQSRPFVSGGAAWNLSDFNSEFRSETMPHTNNKGLMNIAREPKDTYWLYQASLTQKPMVKIGTSLWSYKAGVADSLTAVSTQMVQVITNSKSVELFLDGKSLGTSTATDHVSEFKVPFKAGINHLLAVSEDKVTDTKDIDFNLVPASFANPQTPFKEINVLLGANRYYFDAAKKQVWIPDQAYKPGSWGHIGGNMFKIPNSLQPYGSAKNINDTENDPVYQTQQEGLEAYRLDVPDGEYLLTLHFAELTGGVTRKVVNDLSNAANAGTEAAQQRIFSVLVNGTKLLDSLNIGAEYGMVTAAQKQFKVTVLDGKGVLINFVAIEGKPVLNALQLRKLL